MNKFGVKGKKNKSQAKPKSSTSRGRLNSKDDNRGEEAEEGGGSGKAEEPFQDETRLEKLLAASRAKKQSIWETICHEIELEGNEVDLILRRLRLPRYNYRKDKMFLLPFLDSHGMNYHMPNKGWGIGTDDDGHQKIKMRTCISRVYLDHYIFPRLLPAIQWMLRYALKERVFQCDKGLFNPLDCIVEHLYANNPQHPERKMNLIPIHEIPFAAQWLAKYPRPPYPKWLTMSEDEAARIIQNGVRAWLSRRKRKERKARKGLKRKEVLNSTGKGACGKGGPESKLGPAPLFAPYYDELTGGGGESADVSRTHSYHCFVCSRFREFLQENKERHETGAGGGNVQLHS